MTDMLAISNAAADAAGIPRLLLLAAGIAESNLRADARRPADPSKDAAYWPDVSGGAWQQTVRYDPAYRGGSEYPGPEEVERVLALQYDPARSAKIAAENLAQKWAMYKPNTLAALQAYNWPAGAGRPYSAAHEQNYRRGLAEAEQMLANYKPVAPATKRAAFDPTTPDEKQRQDWTCAIRSTMWLLKSIGIDVTPDEAQDAMSPRYVTPDLGLLNADGSGIVAVLRDQWGVAAENHAAVTFDEVAALAGKQPVAIGGRNWGGPGKGHWSAVRGYDGTRLLLANPASGTVYGDASLTREQWSWRGPWSAVVVPLPSPGVGTGPSASNDEDTILGLRAAVAHLTDVVVPKAAAAAAEREAALAEAKRIRAEFVGVKP